MFDSFAIVDWSGGRDTGPRPRKDAIWIGFVRGGRQEAPVYLRNRDLAEAYIEDLIQAELEAGRRLLIGFDFPFGYPKGVAQALTGRDDPFSLWKWFEERISDTHRGENNRFDLAGQINRSFPGVGPFWGNGLKRDVDGLPRKGRARSDMSFPEKRECELKAKGAFSVWQMSGVGSVGGQVMTGLPVLQRLRIKFQDAISVWPFEPHDRQVCIVEIWPGLINPLVRQVCGPNDIRDAVQVHVLANSLSRLQPSALSRMLSVKAPEEGWILGLGFEEDLMAAASKLTPPSLKNDCFALPPGVDWTPVDEALARLRQRLHPVVGFEEVPLKHSDGRVLSEDVLALRSNPPTANTAVDGYGVCADGLSDGVDELPLMTGRSAAGSPSEAPLKTGHAIRVLTGASLPDGVDTVILQEDVTTDGKAISFRGPIRRGANTRQAGEDVMKGDVILSAGRRVTPADVALLAATGHDEVSVRKRLRVAILSTGDELTEAGDTATPDKIYDANRPMLASLLTRMGYDVLDQGRVADSKDALRSAFDKAASEADVIITSGGASSGDEDHVSALLQAEGNMQNWRIAVKPGRPLALALWRGTPVFGLPGNPVAAMVCTCIFARPALAVLSGQTWTEPVAMTLPAGFSKKKKPGRREYLRARLRDGVVETFKSEGSGRISGLSWAEGLVELGDDAQTIEPGDPVRFLPYSSFWD